jgi:ribonuclease E
MTKRMLIDATHAEETRVVVLDGSRLEDFDVETSTKKQLKGNIYLAKVVRVEPSLQAAFVEYGGNRHGFLAFGEIHPDYYQIPVADRQRLLAMEAEDARREAEEEDRAALSSADTVMPDGGVETDLAADHGDSPSEPEDGAADRATNEVETVESATALPEPPVAADPVAPVVAPLRAQPARIETESVGGVLEAPETLFDAELLGVPAASAMAEVVEPAAEPETISTTRELAEIDRRTTGGRNRRPRRRGGRRGER